VNGTERIETVIVGGGQSGLAVGYNLARAGRPFVILEANQRLGDSWRMRWDSLRVFTPAWLSALDGMPIPAPKWSFPTKDALADYFEAYAARFELPVRTGVSVTRVSRDGQRFMVETTRGRIEADNVVVASGQDHTPKTPGFARELDAGIRQLHSKDYRNPSQLQAGPALVVGAGNSGAEIALEIARTRTTLLSGRYWRAPVGPSRHPLLTLAFYPIFLHLLTIDTPIGRKARTKLIHSSVPVERVRRKDLVAAGVELVARTVGARNGSPRLEDGRVVDVANVIWCTGYRTDLGWIDLPITGDDGLPLEERGVVASIPGLYFVGRLFQYSVTSALLGPGLVRDGAYIARQITARAAAPSASVADPVARSA